jgi:pyridinium-3,5-bisthiocarboxylic acid mononucleotide nickel chelatase
MRIAYLDCFSGISGDMFLGAAVDAGVSLEKLEHVTAALGLNTRLTAHRLNRGGIGGTKVDVVINGHADVPLDLDPEPEAAHAHVHFHAEHSHSHAAVGLHEHAEHAAHTGHEHEAAHAGHVHRGLQEIREIIGRAPISSGAQAFAIDAFELLARAEAAIHNLDPETIHFHEVGSEDAIVDIVCAAVAAETIAADEWYCSALNVGGGTVLCAHGLLPVPAPATVELLRGAPVFSSGIQKELITPTGAAILRALKVKFQPLPRITITATGYGAGAREIPGTPNLLRLTLGDAVAAHVAFEKTWGLDETDTVVILEANIDDMNPQLFSYVQQKLLSSGALDAFGVPVQMKKGRPGIVFTVLAAPALAEPLSRILLTETTTLGVRMRQEQRRILEREHVTVESAWGPIRVKLGRLHGEVVNCAPEFEDCRKIAESTGVPLKTVLQEAMRLYLASCRADDCTAENAANSNDTSKSFLS